MHLLLFYFVRVDWALKSLWYLLSLLMKWCYWCYYSWTDSVHELILFLRKWSYFMLFFTALMCLFQIEEEAISQLLKKYGAHERSDEHITVERVSGPMAAPLWNLKRSNSSSHTWLNFHSFQLCLTECHNIFVLVEVTLGGGISELLITVLPKDTKSLSLRETSSDLSFLYFLICWTILFCMLITFLEFHNSVILVWIILTCFQGHSNVWKVGVFFVYNLITQSY